MECWNNGKLEAENKEEYRRQKTGEDTKLKIQNA
jgi:hypothetical protein